jgi:hypothetical protein
MPIYQKGSKVELRFIYCLNELQRWQLSNAASKYRTTVRTPLKHGTCLRHGDVWSTLIFNVVRRAKLQTTGSIFNKQKQLIAYVARSLAAVHDALQALEAGAAKVGLKINEQKTKYMIASLKVNNPLNRIFLH